MADLSENHDLTAGGIDTGIGLADAFLEIQHHRTGTVNHLKAKLFCLGVCGRRFAMSADKKAVAFMEG